MTEEEQGQMEEEEVVIQDEPELAVEEETTPMDEPELAVAEEGDIWDEPVERQGRGGPAVVIGIVAVALAFCACVVCIAAAFAAFSGGSEASVTGVVTYRQRIALPDDAVVTVQIQDVSRADVAADIIGEQIIENPGQVPIPYDVAYDPDAIDERHSYSMSARIEDSNGKLLFISTTNIPVVTSGNPTEDVEIVVEPVSAGLQPPPAAQAYIKIDQPTNGETVDISKPVTVSGTGAGLPEGNVVVQALDWKGNVLAEQPATIQTSDAGTGGEGPWSVQLTIETKPGTAGKIYAFSPSPEDGSIIAEDSVEVSLGTTAPMPTYIKIEEPAEGSTVDITKPVTVSGTGGGLPEGNVVVQALDWQGNVLAEQYATVQGPDAGTGGEGPWSVQLMIEAEPGTAGRIYAFAPSPKDGSIIAEDTVHVSLGETAAVPTFLEIDEPVEGAELDTANPITVSGVGGGLPEGNVVVMALDANDTVLAEQATTLQGADVSTGGTGTWSAQLIVGAPAGAVGRIVALSPSPADDSIIASAVVNVKYGGESESGLEGTNWILTNTLPEAQITALFENGKVSGSAGCNTYFGSYTTSQSASKNTIEFGPLGTTRMMCPEEVMDQEQLYLSALDLATEYQVEENVLTLTVPGGSLQFEGETVP